VELQQLNLNGMLHIVGFVTLCEGFLGIDPHTKLFQTFFYSWALSAKGDLELVRSGLRPAEKGSLAGRLPGVHPHGLEPGVA
jgi:hypothetical protein